MGIPESWIVLLERKGDLEEQLESQERMEQMLKDQILKTQTTKRLSVKRISDLEESLRSLGWMGETG